MTSRAAVRLAGVLQAPIRTRFSRRGIVGALTLGATICLLVSGYEPLPATVCDTVDLIEINHCYDQRGQLVLDQLIFYDWSPRKSHYDVRAWRLLESPIQTPRKDVATGRYVAIWRDGKILRKVVAKNVRESWTRYDPEMVERRFLGRAQRRDLQRIVVAPTDKTRR